MKNKTSNTLWQRRQTKGRFLETMKKSNQQWAYDAYGKLRFAS